VDAPARVVHPLLIAALVAVAVVGYLAGHRHSAPRAVAERPPSVTRSLSDSGLLLEYPLGWERATSSTSIPGLALNRPVTLHPRGSSSAGLLVGQLPAGEPGPLPAGFLARLKGLPHVEVVDLVSTQAYRYSQLALAGYGSLDLYLIPSASDGARAVACFARKAPTPADQQCERIVANVALTGPPTGTLTPEPAYAKQLAAVLGSLDAERARARKQMSASSTPSVVSTAASGLASHLSSAAASLAGLPPPPPLATQAAVLVNSLRAAGSAYSQLSTAARQESAPAYDAARTAVTTAEKQVDGALAGVTLLGYGA
jgi:hypothetical protein